MPLWPSAPPGPSPEQAEGDEQVLPHETLVNVARPRLLVHRSNRNRIGIIIVAGDDYTRIERGRESLPLARWLHSLGYTTFELIYRLPGDGWARQAPFQDMQRALRVVRARAREFRIDPAKVGVVGFGAGGHMASLIAAAPQAAMYKPVDPFDEVEARPAFLGLVYPVASMLPPCEKSPAVLTLLGKKPSEAECTRWSAQTYVGKTMPPMFITAAKDDKVVSVDNSVELVQAADVAGVPVYFVPMVTGGHGFGMGEAATEASRWPAQFFSWLVRSGF